MKTLLIMALIFMCGFQSFSQSVFKNTSSNPTGAITNTSIDTCYYTTSKSYSVISIQPVITKATGTMAGTSVLACSVDGVNYTNVDTLTNSNVTVNSTVWNISSAARHWRIITSGATTVTATVKAYISAN
jgi:hypothetical protein